MRTTQRDQGGMTTFSASIVDAASGSGIAQPGGIPFRWVQSVTGQYNYNFDLRLTPVAMTVSQALGNLNAGTTNLGPGQFQVATTLANTGAAYSGAHRWTCTAIDKRT